MDGAHLRKMLDYDPLTGVFIWRPRESVQWNAKYSGKRAGRVAWNGYRLVSVEYADYREHHLAWLWVHGKLPTNDIDHINGDRSDNRIANLRIATRSQNLANKWDESRNTSGFKGVSATGRKTKPWAAHIKINSKSHFLGRHETPEQAHAAYSVKAVELFGEFARLS